MSTSKPPSSAIPRRTRNEALLEFYKKLRPGDPATPGKRQELPERPALQPARYDLGKVGRHKLNRRLGLNVDLATRAL